MSELLTRHEFWIGVGSAVFGIVMFFARKAARGHEPQQYGDEVR